MCNLGITCSVVVMWSSIAMMARLLVVTWFVIIILANCSSIAMVVRVSVASGSSVARVVTGFGVSPGLCGKHSVPMPVSR